MGQALVILVPICVFGLVRNRGSMRTRRNIAVAIACCLTPALGFILYTLGWFLWGFIVERMWIALAILVVAVCPAPWSALRIYRQQQGLGRPTVVAGVRAEAVGLCWLFAATIVIAVLTVPII